MSRSNLINASLAPHVLAVGAAVGAAVGDFVGAAVGPPGSLNSVMQISFWSRRNELIEAGPKYLLFPPFDGNIIKSLEPRS